MSVQASRVLLVEDDPEDARLLREAFKEIGADVDFQHVQDGKTADEVLTRAEKNDALPDIVVLDLHLGPEHGTDLLKAWRSRPAFSNLPVAVLTSSSNERDIEKAKAADATSYYLKPKSLEEYFDLARDLVVFWLGSSPKEHV